MQHSATMQNVYQHLYQYLCRHHCTCVKNNIQHSRLNLPGCPGAHAVGSQLVYHPGPNRMGGKHFAENLRCQVTNQQYSSFRHVQTMLPQCVAQHLQLEILNTSTACNPIRRNAGEVCSLKNLPNGSKWLNDAKRLSTFTN